MNSKHVDVVLDLNTCKHELYDGCLKLEVNVEHRCVNGVSCGLMDKKLMN